MSCASGTSPDRGLPCDGLACVGVQGAGWLLRRSEVNPLACAGKRELDAVCAIGSSLPAAAGGFDVDCKQIDAACISGPSLPVPTLGLVMSCWNISWPFGQWKEVNVASVCLGIAPMPGFTCSL